MPSPRLKRRVHISLSTAAVSWRRHCVISFTLHSRHFVYSQWAVLMRFSGIGGVASDFLSLMKSSYFGSNGHGRGMAMVFGFDLQFLHLEWRKAVRQGI